MIVSRTQNDNQVGSIMTSLVFIFTLFIFQAAMEFAINHSIYRELMTPTFVRSACNVGVLHFKTQGNPPPAD